MPKRHFLMLAQKYNRGKHGVGGWYMSEKLDGMRCFWDGGISRGLLKSEVPWANCDKDERYKEAPVATGLWSRLGNVIHAPDEWLDKLPKMPLDGELYWKCKRDGNYLVHDKPRQDLMSRVKKIEPVTKWTDISYYVFDAPCLFTVLDEGVIKVTNFHKTIPQISQWIFEHGQDLEYSPKRDTQFVSTCVILATKLGDSKGPVVILPQVMLPHQTTLAHSTIDAELDLVSVHGEGLMLRKPESKWLPNRVHELLKVKKLDDAEGIVTGYITGRQTELGSKLLGLMGAMILEIDGGKRLELSGFTDRERELSTVDRNEKRSAHSWATDNPETECPSWVQASYFPRGAKVTFQHRGKTKDGIPTEARYWRKYEDSS